MENAVVVQPWRSLFLHSIVSPVDGLCNAIISCILSSPCRIVRFHDIQMDHIHWKWWIVRARVIKKGHLQENYYGDLQIRLILIDELVSQNDFSIFFFKILDLICSLFPL